MNDEMMSFKPDDMVKSCKWLEKGLGFLIGGIHSCVKGSKTSPVLVSIEEIKAGKVTYDLIVQRRKELFLGINGLKEIDLGGCKNCTSICEKRFKDVNFEWAGGEPLPTAFNVQHYTMCNERCLYCVYAQNKDFRAPQYDILSIYELFREKGRLGKNNWIDFSGGEPAMLKNFDQILNYMLDNEMETVVVYSNATIFSESIARGLRENKVILTTSLDTGLKSTYARLRGADLFEKVIDTLTRYRNTGTKGLWLKYIVTEVNRTDDDMWSFIMAMIALRPNSVMICPDYPYGDKEIPDETVRFAARLWYLLERYVGIWIQEYTASFGDPKFVEYRKKLGEYIAQLKAEDWKSMNKKIENIPENAKVAIWGAGGMARKLMQETSLGKLNIVKVYDGDKKKAGSQFEDVPVGPFTPRDIEEKKIDTIIITSSSAQNDILCELEPYREKVNVVILFDRQISLPYKKS